MYFDETNHTHITFISLCNSINILSLLCLVNQKTVTIETHHKLGGEHRHLIEYQYEYV